MNVTREIVLGVSLALSLGEVGQAQSFAQLADMGSGIGPRLTRRVARNRLDRSLFGTVGTKVSFINNGTAYQLATDPIWGRVLIGKKDDYIHAYRGAAATGTPLRQPFGIDISARRKVYVAERGKSRIVVGTLDLGAGSLTDVTHLTLVNRSPIDIAWDGQGTPLTNDYLYLLDDVAGTVTYWNMNSGVPSAPLWSFGSSGTGAGQFLSPSGICVGKTPALTGGTQFTNSFYVVDRGNRRIVWLARSGASASVVGTYTEPNWGPIDCAVDHFGNVYIADQRNNRLVKLNSDLTLITQYGQYGAGVNNLNTFDHPRTISVPCGIKTVNTTRVWYCEGRTITAERWSDSTGVVEHYIGTGAALASPADTGFNSAWVEASWTDPTFVTADIHRVNVGVVRQLFTAQPYPTGTWGIGWDGRLNDGSVAPEGDYVFRIKVVSVYGCPGTSFYPWCSTWLYSSQFHYTYHVPPCDPGGGGLAPMASTALAGPMLAKWPPPPPTCDPGASSPLNGGGMPTKFSVRQLPGVPTDGPSGLAPLYRSGLMPVLTATGEPAAGAKVAIGDVSHFGVMALQVNAPSAGEVRIEIFAQDGRRVNSYTESVADGGMYVFRWDGKDRNSAQVTPGVYVAIVRRNGAQAQSRFIVTSPTR